MSMKKSMKFLVAALALAALSTPAFALEHEVSGRFASFFAVSNYSTPNDFNGRLDKDASTTNWFDQRLRLGYIAKANENVKLVTKFELDYAFWGNSALTNGRGQGGGIGADAVNLETKNIYLDWTASNCNTKIGMQSYDDAFSGIIFSTDMAGILLTHKYSNATASAGFFRWNDSAGKGLFGINKETGLPGRNSQDLFVLDGKYNISKDVKVGAAYYYIQDDTNVPETTTTTIATGAVPIGFTADGTPIYDFADATSTTTPGGGRDAKVHTIGFNAATSLGAVNINGFVLGQFGDYNTKEDAKGYAAKLAANTAVGTGTLRLDALYVAGGKNQLYITRDKNGYYDNEMMILSRDKNQTTIDNAVVYDVNNNGEGVIMAAIGFDQPFSPTLTGSANVGFAMVANNEAANVNISTNMFGDPFSPVSADDDTLGTEVNVELVKKATDNVTLSARAAYLFIGDHYTGNPDNPYAVQTMVSYKF